MDLRRQWRRVWAGAVCLVATGGLLAAEAAADAPAPAPQISSITVPNQAAVVPPYGDLVPGSDGAVWALAYDVPDAYQTMPRTLTLDRFGDAGLLTRAPFPAALASGRLRIPLTPLADGGMATIVADQEGSVEPDVHVSHMSLVRFGPDGQVSETTELPQQARRAYGFAIAPDGTVWFARACQDSLFRRSPGGQLTRRALDHVGCGAHLEREAGAGLTIAPDGAVWFADLCQGRVERLAVDGTLRVWRPKRNSCGYSYDRTIAPAIVHSDPRGGVVWFSSSAYGGGYGGRITAAGRVQRLPLSGSDVFVAANGDVWASGRGFDEAGKAKPVALPDGTTGEVTAQARDGSIWSIAGHSTFHDEYRSSYTSWSDQIAANVTEGGAWPLPAAVATSAADTLSLGPDGALWTPLQDASASGPRPTLAAVRVLPANVMAPRTPTAQIARVLARTGRTAWLQLTCDAERGRFCTGSVTLASGSLVHAPSRFVIAGQARGAVALQLSPSAAKALHRGSLPVSVRVTANGAPLTRTAIRLPAVSRSR
jgi:streptogramin lyase